MKSTRKASPAQARKKTQPEEFDLVILGGGTGSTVAAWTFAGEGKQVAVVERISTDKRPCIDWSGQLLDCRQHGNFPEAAI